MFTDRDRGQANLFFGLVSGISLDRLSGHYCRDGVEMVLNDKGSIVLKNSALQ